MLQLFFAPRTYLVVCLLRASPRESLCHRWASQRPFGPLHGPSAVQGATHKFGRTTTMGALTLEGRKC